MKRLLLLSIICTISVFKINAQKLEVKWIQEFDSKINIIDIPLVDDNFVYIQHKKGKDQYFLQKRRINDNSLVKETQLDFTYKDGSKFNFSSLHINIQKLQLHKLHKEIYAIGVINQIKMKKSKVIIYKLNKATLAFEEHQIVEEIDLSKKEKVEINSFVSQKNGQEQILFEVSKTLKWENTGIYYYIMSKESAEKTDYKTFKNYYTGNDFAELKYGVNKKGKQNLKYATNISISDEEYVLCHPFENSLEERIDEFGLVRKLTSDEKNVNEIFLINYNIAFDKRILMIPILTPVFFNPNNYDDVKDINFYKEFRLTSDGNDKLSIFKRDDDIYVLKIKKKVIHSETTLSNQTSGPTFVSYSDFEIVKIGKDKNFKWYKNISQPTFNSSLKSIVSPVIYNNNIIFFYDNKYLVIDNNTGEYVINQNESFSIKSEFKIKSELIDGSSIVYSVENKNKQKIGIIQFTD